ncbi:MAG: hypothetical protein WCR12_08410 [Dysgonamonadaceae bacterium]
MKSNKLPPKSDTITKLIDYVLLNSCSVNSTGLYNGKAGISLTLFEVSRCLQSEYIEEQAFNLLQEALLSKNEDISFENGLSGIGFVLIYLLKNKFVDGCFEELFDENLNKIFLQLSEIEENPINGRLLLIHLKIVYFLSLLEEYRSSEKSSHFIRFFSKNVNIELERSLANLEKKHDENLKVAFLSSFKNYVNITLSCPSLTLSSRVLEGYTNLYLDNKIVCDFSIGCCLKKIADNRNDKKLKEVAEQNMLFAHNNIYPTVLSLSQRIDLLHLLYQQEKKYEKQIIRLEKDFFENTNEILLEKNLVQYISSNTFMAGYQSGVSRYLLYWIYKNSNKQTNIPFL